MQKIRLMTLNRRNQLIRVSHEVREVHEVHEVREHDSQKIRLMNHRSKQTIRMILLIHQMTVSLLTRVTQPHGVFFELQVNRKIRLMLNIQKIHRS